MRDGAPVHVLIADRSPDLELNPKIVNINNKEVELCCGGCMKKASKMTDTEKFEFLFSDKSLKKGYKVAQK